MIGWKQNVEFLLGLFQKRVDKTTLSNIIVTIVGFAYPEKY